MSKQLHQIDLETCKGDGICVYICPENVLEIVNDKAATVESRLEACIMRGQCVAACPTESLQMPDLPAEDFQELPKPHYDYGEFLSLLKHRRSVRMFKAQPVEKVMIDKILEAAATAPMGIPPHSTGVLVIDRREELDYLLQELVKSYTFMAKGFSNPLGRLMIRLSAGAEHYRAIKNFILKVTKYANEEYHRNGSDRYMYKAPMLMLFHGNRTALSYEENAHLICHHAMLAAVSLGLGTTIIGLVPPVVDRSKVLRKRYNIPSDNKVITSLIVGHPKYKYKKSIRRDLADVQTV